MLSMCDDIELSMLAETGDLDLAERVGFALRTTWEMVASMTGINPEWLEIADASES